VPVQGHDYPEENVEKTFRPAGYAASAGAEKPRLIAKCFFMNYLGTHWVL